MPRFLPPRLLGLRLAGLAALAAAALVLSLITGPSGIDAHGSLNALFGDPDSMARVVLLDLRLPRVLAAFGVGAVLALSGVLLQTLFRNPLADPYVLGVSGGASVGALLAMLTGAGFLATQSGALLGAFAAMLLVQALGRGGSTRLLLTGVITASACGALVSVLLAVADAGQLRGMVFWLAGDLGWAQTPWLGIGVALAAVTASVLLARPLNVLASGELRAQSVGLDLRLWRTLVFVGCAALTAVAVVSAGTVGFVGLVTPHAVRLLYRSGDHRLVAPAAAILGGTLLVLADLLARTIASPRQLPVGAIMALVGAPLFIALLRASVRNEATG